MSSGLISVGLAAALLMATTVRAECPLPDPADCIYVDDNCNPPGTGTPADPFCMIQQAYDGATAGQTILVKAGTYNECVLASGFVAWDDPSNQDKPVHLVADEWQENPLRPLDAGFDSVASLTVIHGAGICDGVFPLPLSPTVFLGGTNASIQGFKITGGGDGGVAAQGSVAITNNLITENLAQLGGGVYFYSGSCFYGDVDATIADNHVTDNLADDIYESGSGWGGGIYVYARGSEPDPFSNCVGGAVDVGVSGNVVTGNRASNLIADPVVLDFTSLGGGIFAQTDTPLPTALPAIASASHVAITQNVVSNNEILEGSAGYGAGIWSNTFGYGMETIEIRDNTVGPDNIAPANGGGISVWVTAVVAAQHSVIVEGNTVTGNRAGFGGGMDLLMDVRSLTTGRSVALVASDNAITDNHSDFDGGGLFVEYLSQRSASVADGTTNPHPAADITYLVQRNKVMNNVAGLGGGGAIVYASAYADPEGQSLCAPVLQAATTAHVRFEGNLIAENTAENSDPPLTGDIIGAGLLAFPAAFGEAWATVSVSTSTIAQNDIGPNGGFVGGIEVAGVTGFDCDRQKLGQTLVSVANTIVSGNEAMGIGGPIPEPGNTATATYSDFFGNSGGNYASTLFPVDPTGTLGNISEDPLFVDPGGLYHVAGNSPVIDAGDTAYVNSSGTDIDGDARVLDGDDDGIARVDMGSDEFLLDCVDASDTGPCNDGNACTTGDTCSGGTCQPGAPLVCDDGDPCTADSCSPASGCEYEHICCAENDPRTQGYYQRLCQPGNPPQADPLGVADVDCINDSCAFASAGSVADLCSVLDPPPPGSYCSRARAQFMALLLNACRGRVCEGDPITSTCSEHSTVGESMAHADALLCNPSATSSDCADAWCESREINTGQALGLDTLLVSKEGSGIRLTWREPLHDPQQSVRYAVRAGQLGQATWSLLAETQALDYVDASAGSSDGAYQYEVVAILE